MYLLVGEKQNLLAVEILLETPQSVYLAMEILLKIPQFASTSGWVYLPFLGTCCGSLSSAQLKRNFSCHTPAECCMQYLYWEKS